MNPKSLFVADVGNTSIDVGRFELEAGRFPRPAATVKLSLEAFHESDWLRCSEKTRWLIGSVNHSANERLEQHLVQQNADVQIVHRRDFPIETVIRNFESVGIDRLASCSAVNRLRSPEHVAIIVDAGSAITVDCVSHQGVFLGGMIAPGLRLCAQTLAKNTDQLPSIEVPDGVPSLIGDDTNSAIQAGVFWLIAAGIDGILRQLKTELARPCDIFVTGGSMPWLLSHLSHHQPVHEPDLVLSGLALTAIHES